MKPRKNTFVVMPAKAGIQSVIAWQQLFKSWIPAFAGMTSFFRDEKYL